MNTHIDNDKVKYAFFGTGPLAEAAIYTLYHAGHIPDAIITKPDAVVGRDHILTAPIIKTWAISKGIKVYQPTTLNVNKLLESDIAADIGFYNYYNQCKLDIAIVASYGKIIPQNILDWPVHGIINIHPSMLPLYRGPSPIESQLLDGLESIGLSIMRLEAGMDSGPVYIQKAIDLNSFNTSADYNSETLERYTGREGASMIAQILPFIIDGSIKPRVQDESKATYCKFIDKSQGDVTECILEGLNNKDNIDIVKLSEESVKQIIIKWRALNPWPGLYFYIDHNDKKLRVKINKIDIESPSLILEVTPEGKKPMSWDSFKNGYMMN